MKYIIILIIILLLIYWFSKQQNNNLQHYDYIYGNKWVVIIAGVHGNEPAGSKLMVELINSGYIREMAKQKKINIRVIPKANEWGLKMNLRYQPGLYPDINRNFTDTIKDETAIKIHELIKPADLIIDLHEGWGFHRRNKHSLGSSVSPATDKLSEHLANISVNELNKYINDSDKKFIVLYNRPCEIKNTLSCHSKKLFKHYILIETSGQNNIQPIEVRVNQAFILVDTILKNY